VPAKRCKLCEELLYKEEHEGLCRSCRHRHGIPKGTPPARPQVPCVRCNSTVFVRVRLRENAVGNLGGETNHAAARPACVTYGLNELTSFWSGKHTGWAVDMEQIVGAMNAYVCRQCGFTELYTTAPQEIPIGEEYATELFEVQEPPPYR
jgi:hypothetical protein